MERTALKSLVSRGPRAFRTQQFRRTFARSTPRPGADASGNAIRQVGTSFKGCQSVPRIPALVWRDMCQCPKCVEPSSRQKLFQTCDIPVNIEISALEDQRVDGRAGFKITFDRDIDLPEYQDHIAFVPATVADAFFRKPERPDIKTTWDRLRMARDVLWVDYNDYLNTDATLLRTLRQLNTHGLVFLSGVPEAESSVVRIVERIGPLRETFYGRTWDVKSIPNAQNIAYTDRYLGLHMDLMYLTNPPHLQLLHSLRARAPGGESLFSDSHHAAEVIRERDGNAFFELCTRNVNFHYDNAGQHYQTSRPTIELDTRGAPLDIAFPPRSFPDGERTLERTATIDSAIRRINWSPPFQAPFSHAGHGQAMTGFVRAAKQFHDLANAAANVYELKLREGECVVFDNRRVLHARREFDAGRGERWLKGAYVDDDVFRSRLRVLERAAEPTDAAAAAAA